jgi:hypothetical protein
MISHAEWRPLGLNTGALELEQPVFGDTVSRGLTAKTLLHYVR